MVFTGRWDGERVYAELTGWGVVNLDIYSKEIHRQYQAEVDAERNEKANKGAKDL